MPFFPIFLWSTIYSSIVDEKFKRFNDLLMACEKLEGIVEYMRIVQTDRIIMKSLMMLFSKVLIKTLQAEVNYELKMVPQFAIHTPKGTIRLE